MLYKCSERKAILRILLVALTSGPCAVEAWELQGTKTISALTSDKQQIRLGTVHFEPQASGAAAFRISLDYAQFTDHFLSMKVFKCLEGPRELACHMPYPYPQPGTVTPTDMSWLEHSLLFLYKLPNDFGAKFWNGLYFRLERTERGLVGRPQAIDLNRISAPPDEPGIPPFHPAIRDDIAAGARWLDSIVIE